MVANNIKSLLLHLNELMTNTLQGGVGYCVERTHYEITVEHLLFKLLDENESDLEYILKHFNISKEKLEHGLNADLEELTTGNSNKPVFSPLLLELLQDSWIKSSIDFEEKKIRSATFILSLLSRKNYYVNGRYLDLLKGINKETLENNFFDIVKDSVEQQSAQAEPSTSSSSPTKTGFLEKFCVDITARAKEGKIDPVFGREKEIRQMIDILARRRKNNPICVGEPGVGKTAVIEGLAVKIAEDDVPSILKNVQLLSLDMALLEAGASVKGEFENRLKGIINEVKSSEKPIILFIDEAHTLIGGSGSGGSDDAANILKPALARGELRTIAATTWSEYKKYFEKDPAMARRFQLVKLEEPSTQNAILILRGLKKFYEEAHNVTIRDDAVETAVNISDKYITGRFLPDKAIDLLDTSCARIKINLSSKPAKLEDKEKVLEALIREKNALERDIDNNISVDEDKIKVNSTQIEEIKKDIESLSSQYLEQKKCAEELLAMREKIASCEDAKQKESLRNELLVIEDKFNALKSENNFIEVDVNPDTVAQVVSDWTGIPLGRMLRDEAKMMLELENNLKQNIKGQDHVFDVVAEIIRSSKSGITDPDQPIGIFLYAGPSGVGKTETGLILAEQIFGSRKQVITVNMSEFQESHTVSRLIGSPPGYVGYGEGGMLTEAVRKNPYSVVILDEVEKAHINIMELFYQVFDKGILSDGEGKEISFKNTIIILTSNLATNIIEDYCAKNSTDINIEDIEKDIRPTLTKHFKPALLGRMTVIPFLSLNEEAMKAITILKLAKLEKRLHKNNKMSLTYDDKVVEQIVSRCTEVQSGARNIEHIINTKVLPTLSREILSTMGDDKMPDTVFIDVDENRNFIINFDNI
ncbi:MAG: type VI secretion system ATPase TssH [Helicobacteraceae bacterium]|nr:type VI secretion system ATPase TssH [Helicobacteraceae bacterium]